MSLLEDVFLEDETGEAQELERVIEGDEFDDRPRSVASNSDDNSEKEDEAAEDRRRVDPTKAKTVRVVKNPRVILNPARLTGPRGIHVIPDHFKDFKFKGKGHEKEDLDLVLKKLEHWAYRLFPKFEFGDCLKKIETLGKKRPVMVHLHKIRSDQFTTEETVVQKDSSDDEPPEQPPEQDEFDKLLQQQIELARATPAPGSVTKRGFETPNIDKRSPFTMPKATSSPSISDEQRDRMIRNRQLAEEKRLARLKQNTSANNSTTYVDLSNIDTSNSINVEDNAGNKHNKSKYSATAVDLTNVDSSCKNTDVTIVKKHNRSNVIDSSDDEDSTTVNQPITVDLQSHDVEVNIAKRNHFDVNAAKRHNRANVIDSSVVQMNELHNTTNKYAVEASEEKADKITNVMDEEFDINVVSNTNVTVDLTEGVPIKHSDVFTEGQIIDIGDEYSGHVRIIKHNKSNVVDSLDEECEMESSNQSFRIDQHTKFYTENNKNHNSNVEKAKTENNKKLNCDHETEVIDKHFEENQNELSEKDKKSNNIKVTTKDNSETAIIEGQNESNTPDLVTNKKDLINLSSLKVKRDVTSDPVEELMDVDFSDDF